MNKKLATSLVVVGSLFAIVAFAAVVNYISNSISTDVSVDSPVLLSDDSFTFDIHYGGERGTAVFTLENRANVDLTGDIEIEMRKNGALVTDDTGLNLALSEDIDYCYAGMGDMTGVTDCDTDYEQWVLNNPDWLDWYGNAVYAGNYEPTYVSNADGNSYVQVPAVGGVLTLPDVDIPASATFHGVVYLGTDAAISPGAYSFKVTVRP